MVALLHTLLARVRAFLRPADVDAEIEQDTRSCRSPWPAAGVRLRPGPRLGLVRPVCSPGFSAARRDRSPSGAGVLLALWLGIYLAIDAIGGAKLPVLIPVAAGMMTIVGLLAAAGPGRRALPLDPTEALRDD